MKTWHIITCEYPPQIGGVSDYTHLLAKQLDSSGDSVHIWAPAASRQSTNTNDAGVTVHRSLGNFSKTDLETTSQLLNQIDKGRPRNLLVQWVPHGYGKRAMNLAFCHWIERLVKSGDRMELMVHEPYLEYGQGSWKRNIVAFVQRRMIRILLDVSSRVYISIPAWENYLRPYAPSDREMIWLPVPATIPVLNDARAIAARRRRIGEQALILGHLGTYPDAITRVLDPGLILVLRDVPNSHLLLLGKGSHQFANEISKKYPDLKKRIHATGPLQDHDLSHHLSACDLVLQPFPDGLSTRRTSLMNALAHGIPVVSNSGHLTEEIWEENGAVALGATGTGPDLAPVCTRLLLDQSARKSFGEKGAELYRTRFDWPNILSVLRSSPDRKSAVAPK